MLHGKGCRLHGNKTELSFYPGLPSAGLLPGAEGVVQAREPASHPSACTANTLVFDSTLSGYLVQSVWNGFYISSGTGTLKGCLAAMGSLTGKFSSGKCLSYHELVLVWVFFSSWDLNVEELE